MVQHVYTNHYTLPFGVTQSFNKCRLQAQVYGLAMYVRMPSLQKSACSQFEACLDFDVQEGMAAATVVYGDTTAQDRGLRDVLVKQWVDTCSIHPVTPSPTVLIPCVRSISQYSFKLLGYGEGTTENRAILRSLPHFAYDVAIQQAICASKPSRLLLPGYGSSELHCKGCNEIAFMPGLEDYRCPECWVLLERKPNGSLLRFLALLGAWGSKSSSQGWFTSIRLWLLGWRL